MSSEMTLILGEPKRTVYSTSQSKAHACQVIKGSSGPSHSGHSGSSNLSSGYFSDLERIVE